MKRDKAVELLTHYFGLAGIELNSDTRYEIAEIVNFIIEAAREKIPENVQL